MEQEEYVNAATIGSIQEVAVRALMIAGGEAIRSKDAAVVAEDVSTRIAKKLQLNGSAQA